MREQIRYKYERSKKVKNVSIIQYRQEKYRRIGIEIYRKVHKNKNTDEQEKNEKNEKNEKKRVNIKDGQKEDNEEYRGKTERQKKRMRNMLKKNILKN